MSEYYGVQRSEEYLAHYGILGMKWGQRKNAYELKKAYKALQKGQGSEKLKNTVAYKKLMADTQKERTAKEKAYHDADKIEKDFYKNKRLVDKHRRMVSKEMAKSIGITPDQYYRGMNYDDHFGQGESFRNYLKSNPKAKAEYDRRSKIAREATANYERKARKSIDESLGKYQNKKHGKRSTNVTINGKPWRSRSSLGSSLMYSYYRT